MSEFVFKKEESFDSNVNNENDKKELEKLTETKFDNFHQLNKEIRKFNAHISTNLSSINSFIKPVIREIPFILNELPVFYHTCPSSHPYGRYYIGKVQVIE